MKKETNLDIEKQYEHNYDVYDPIVIAYQLLGTINIRWCMKNYKKQLDAILKVHKTPKIIAHIIKNNRLI